MLEVLFGVKLYYTWNLFNFPYQVEGKGESKSDQIDLDTTY